MKNNLSNSSEYRQIIIGRNSKIWSIIGNKNLGAAIAIGHSEVTSFDFNVNDRVWIFSYSRLPHENQKIFECLHSCGVREIIYISSSSTNVISTTNCYAYPRIKKQAADDAIRMCNARVLTIGLFYENENSLPSGRSVVTSAEELLEFMVNPTLPQPGSTTLLFRRIEKPFATFHERQLYKMYGSLLSIFDSMPCLLRPLDFALRGMGYNWYGYFYLSNKLWFTTIL